MRSLAWLAALAALTALAAAAPGARAAPADPLAGDPGWVHELVLLCGAPASASLSWCAPPAAPPAPPAVRPVVPPPVPPEPPGTVSISSRQAHDPSSLTANQVVAKIQAAYLGPVRRCYRDALARRPGLRGTLRLDFIVNAIGKVDELSVKGVDAVAACVGRHAAGWRFPIPQSTYREPRNARFTIGLALAP